MVDHAYVINPLSNYGTNEAATWPRRRFDIIVALHHQSGDIIKRQDAWPIDNGVVSRDAPPYNQHCGNAAGRLARGGVFAIVRHEWGCPCCHLSDIYYREFCLKKMLLNYYQLGRLDCLYRPLHYLNIYTSTITLWVNWCQFIFGTGLIRVTILGTTFFWMMILISLSNQIEKHDVLV